ncbi:hypothetical protein SAMN05877753_103137 [Bacillus oleivorans]|uniref:Uncharacterized protein n=1 Tax=Bacillus oleivorans TaxID=1448271 RepID=A0A285CQB6_9BACI|nr:hypothetical protein [Bacillus oleivorans]SNX69605.1 hypothetical protein SAMN05877753_103137 [Bacillus oleivorans]
MRKVGVFVGVTAGIFSMFLWVVFSFFNPYSTPSAEPTLNTFVTLFLPACLAIFASLTSKKFLMLAAFLWSLPISYYVLLTPSIFALFGVTCILYFLSFLLLLFTKDHNLNV